MIEESIGMPASWAYNYMKICCKDNTTESMNEKGMRRKILNKNDNFYYVSFQ